jgi:predicted flavoprotein YhiN
MAKHFGAPLKRVSASCNGLTKRGEAVITKGGLEGGVIYALSQSIRNAIAQSPSTAALTLDLRPDMDMEALAQRFEQAAKKDSLSNMLRKAASLSPAAIAVLRESGPLPRGALDLATRIKSVPVAITGLAGLERAISSAGGVTAESLDGALMLKSLPGVFVAGEMLDFDAPTGGYLLQAAFATGHAAAAAMAARLARKTDDVPR